MKALCVDCGVEPKVAKSSRCKACEQANRRANYKAGGRVRDAAVSQFRRARAFLDAIKDLPCHDCGGKFPSECMDFDHRDPELKSFRIGTQRVPKAVGSKHPERAAESYRKLMLEVSKCDLVCANCHRIRTRKQVEAGTITLGRKYAGRFVEAWDS